MKINRVCSYTCDTTSQKPQDFHSLTQMSGYYQQLYQYSQFPDLAVKLRHNKVDKKIQFLN